MALVVLEQPRRGAPQQGVPAVLLLAPAQQRGAEVGVDAQQAPVLKRLLVQPLEALAPFRPLAGLDQAAGLLVARRGREGPDPLEEPPVLRQGAVGRAHVLLAG